MDSIFWNINNSVSYNALFNFIVGNRGGGKTYGLKNYVINKFIKKGEQFVYLRRYKTEIKRVNTFFDDISKNFPETEFKVQGKNFYINNKLAGYAISLSNSKIEKSVAFPDVTNIIFDEFILDKGTHHYLADEVLIFLEFYETVARMRDVKVYFLANAISTINPYFQYFNINIPYNSKISCKNDILIELVENVEFIEEKKKTRFGKLIADTLYSDYAIENKFLRDNKTFIAKKSGVCNYMYTIVYKDNKIGIWANYSKGNIYCSNAIDDKFNEFALTKEDHTANTMLLNATKKHNPFKELMINFSYGNVFFETQKIKSLMYEIFKLLFNT